MKLNLPVLAYVIGYALGAYTAYKLLQEYQGRRAPAGQARRRVELEERAELIEAELQGVRLVREETAGHVEPAVMGVFGPLPVAEG